MHQMRKFGVCQALQKIKNDVLYTFKRLRFILVAND